MPINPKIYRQWLEVAKTYLAKGKAAALTIKLLVPVVALTLVYQNCSPTRFSAVGPNSSSVDNLGTGGGGWCSPTIAINNGALYTTSPSVQLSLSCTQATQMLVSNDPGCIQDPVTGIWQAYAPSLPWTLGALNATDTVYVQFKNATQSSNCINASILQDNIPPTVTITPNVGTTAQTALTFTIIASDGGSGVDPQSLVCTLDSSACPATSTTTNLGGGSYQFVIPLSGLSEGVHTISALAKDLAGNVSAPVQQNFTVETSAPIVTINSGPSQPSSNQTYATFQFSATDKFSTIASYSCTLDGQVSACASPQTYSGPLSQTSHIFSVTATDAAGNTSLPATYTWAISMTVPTVTLTGEPPAYSNNPTPSFTFVGTSPNGPMTSYICQVSGFAAQSCTSPYTTPNLSQGTYTIAVIGTDSTGTHSSPATYTWVVDLTPPTVTLTQTPLARTNQSTGTFAFTVTDNNPGATAQCSLDGEAATSCNASITYPNLTEGTHSFTIIATDIAGNVSQPVTYSWFIDLTPPTIQILGGPGNPTTSTAANFTLQASDPNGGTVAQLLCRLDNATFTTCNSTPQFSGLPIGAHTFYAEAVDSVGNMSAPASYSWNITGDTPVITITQQPANPSSTTIPAVVQYTVTDPVVASSSLTIQCGFDGAVASCPANGTQTLTNPSVGQHTFAITATNAVGNSASQTITWQSATVIQYPATSNMAAVTYEDNFPNPGDADYNDFITDFRIVETVNAQNQITKIFIDFYPRAVGSGSNHSFLMVLSGVKQQPSNITKTTTPTFNGNASNIILTHYDASGNVTSTQTNLSKTSDIVIFPSTHSLFGSGAIRNADGTPQIDTIIAEPAQAPNQSARLEIDIADPTQNLAPANGQINIAQFRFILHVIGYLTTVSAHQSKQSGSSSSSASTTIPQYSTTYGNTKDIDIIDVDPTNFDSKGYPFGFVIPTNWQWPAEFVNINTVYPQFANYRQYLLSGGASSNTSAPQTTLQWYQYPVQDSTQIYPLPAAPNLLPYPN